VGRRAAAGGMDGPRGLGTRERVMSPLTMIDRHNISHRVPFHTEITTHRTPFSRYHTTIVNDMLAHGQSSPPAQTATPDKTLFLQTKMRTQRKLTQDLPDCPGS